MSNDNTRALTKLLVEAEKLKNHREDGEIYSEKCANLVGRIKSVFDDVKNSQLSRGQLAIVKSIQEIISAEETFANASFESRMPKKWNKFLNE